MGGRAGGGAGFGSGGFRELSEGEYKRLAETQNVTKEQERILYDADTTYIDSSWSREINAELTKNKIGNTIPADFMDAESRTAIKTLDDAIAQNKATKNITVKRRVSEYWLTEGGRTLKQGAVFTEHRFTSTSAVGDKNYFGRRKVHLTIDVPNGKNMFVTKNHAESEIVLPRNTKFKVTKFKSSGGITEVKLKVM